jgi:hypothetical protein
MTILDNSTSTSIVPSHEEMWRLSIDAEIEELQRGILASRHLSELIFVLSHGVSRLAEIERRWN